MRVGKLPENSLRGVEEVHAKNRGTIVLLNGGPKDGESYHCPPNALSIRFYAVPSADNNHYEDMGFIKKHAYIEYEVKDDEAIFTGSYKGESGEV